LKNKQNPFWGCSVKETCLHLGSGNGKKIIVQEDLDLWEELTERTASYRITGPIKWEYGLVHLWELTKIPKPVLLRMTIQTGFDTFALRGRLIMEE